MLLRTDPFRDLERLSQQFFGSQGTLAHPTMMPMDAWRDEDQFHIELDLPGSAQSPLTSTSNRIFSQSKHDEMGRMIPRS